MRSALAQLGLKQRRKDEDFNRRRKNEETVFDPIWHSGTKGDRTAPQLNGARYFSFEELKKYTDNFSENNKIDEDAFGKVYKGYCTDGLVVAVKRAKKDYLFSTKEFQIEIEVLSKIHHKSVSRLVGFCREQGEHVLVYEYISKGSLKDNLAGKGGMYLNWKKRLQIALDSARGLAYLHELANPPIIHGHVKSENIMLDENLNAKVADFGFSRLVIEMENEHVSSQVKRTLEYVESADNIIRGTYGYVAPEYLECGVFSDKSDVYGFGVVMLELITARNAFEYGTDENTVLVTDVKRAFDQNDQEYDGLKKIIDPKIIKQVRNVALRSFAQLALKCVEYSALDRPSMYEIMKEIDVILQHYESE
ncbi:hypothetical protein LUZ61_006506 [Rhynchospora tenuis]|uniref:Protein kinase domain-containing protein n=1 Tax=Rhynchospora tenuis TaxID=198213 RepID=A0AAD5ZRS0_9POAL|nr:hypothetical protein LUZ61_006506 [Rhynchospora tenuis]